MDGVEFGAATFLERHSGLLRITTGLSGVAKVAASWMITPCGATSRFDGRSHETGSEPAEGEREQMSWRGPANKNQSFGIWTFSMIKGQGGVDSRTHTWLHLSPLPTQRWSRRTSTAISDHTSELRLGKDELRTLLPGCVTNMRAWRCWC